MDFNQLCQKITSALGNANCQSEVELVQVNAEEKLYHVTFHAGREKEPDVLVLKFSIALNIPTLIDKLQTNHSLMIGEETILTFVKKKSLDIIQHLKQYNGGSNDYDKIARVFYDGRGAILMERFGI